MRTGSDILHRISEILQTGIGNLARKSFM